MKVVKSTNDLKRLALTKGASVSVGGVKFNIDQVKAKVEPPEPPKPPEPPQQTGNQDFVDAVQAVAASNDELGKSNNLVMSELKKLLSKQEPHKKWRLTVNRDTRGVLQSIDVEQTQ